MLTAAIGRSPEIPCGRAERGAGVQDGAGQLLKAAGLVRLDAQAAELDLGVRPCEIELAGDRFGIAVLLDHGQGILARLRGAEDEGNTDPPPGLQHHRAAQAEYRVEDMPGGPRQRAGQGRREADGAATPDETLPVRFELRRAGRLPLDRDAVRRVDR